ncbi:DUF7455 domain-containing protein [Nesterenkonia alkaliphila]|uniref:DUF7455 domain-containing protein n=1 Tax=Nesterenkonia alkaliphila TaxID=1463631 RepID=A0A7K1UM34_9MICC|nr:hypothetical protein [Nesterenkonia alkaliphila]MVT27382.1 hypothetical protein [Nesterenkonia alkaliphila]GFZ80462.1 hypothetical protein GCM10011359_06070 [Nesterenkonia alkaliphila]
MTATTGTLEATTKLTALDRCDRCGAQAYIRAELLSGGVLLFCNHHGRDVEAKLRPQTASWIDESDRIS